MPLILFAIVLLVWMVPSALAGEYDVCARGLGDLFSRTAHVHLSSEGPELGQNASQVLAQLINRHVWQGQAREVFLETYDETLCSAAMGNRYVIAISVTQAELDQIESERDRGMPTNQSPTVAILNQRASVSSQSADISLASAPGYYTLRVYYATNRNDTGDADPKKRFGFGHGAGNLFGAVHVTIPKDHRMGELETPSILKVEFREDPEKHITVQALQPLGQAAWKQELRTRATAFGRPGVLLFIHGYNVGFADAAIRAAQLTYDLAFPGPTVFFSWPSSGKPTSYLADEQAAEWSMSFMKGVLADLASLGPGVPVYVIAHSMGNRVLTRAFKDLLEEDLTRRRAFKEVVLTAPDIDADVFKNQIAPSILGKGPRVTLYASSNDLALAGSRKLHGDFQRLGESSPAIMLLADMDAVDASNVKTDFLAHSYYGDSRTVMSDLFYLIRHRLKPEERFSLEQVQSPVGKYFRFKP